MLQRIRVLADEWGREVAGHVQGRGMPVGRRLASASSRTATPRWRVAGLATLLLISILPAQAQQQTGACAALAPRFQRLSLEDGLSQSVVTAMAQDADGYLWFGTQEGLNRYDGYSFEVFRQDSSRQDSPVQGSPVQSASWQDGSRADAGLPASEISALLAAGDSVWIGTTHGLARYRRDQGFQRQPLPAPAGEPLRVLALAADSEQTLYVGTLEQGLFRKAAQDDAFQPLTGGDLPDGTAIRTLLHDAGRLWVGTPRGLFLFLPHNRSFSRVTSFASEAVTALHRDQQGQLWVAAGNRLWRYDESSEQRLAYSQIHPQLPAPPLAPIQAIAEDAGGRLWLATEQGAFVLMADAGAACLFDEESPAPGALAASDVLSLLRDRSGVLWFGTYTGGLNRWNSTSAGFRSLVPPGLSGASAMVSAVWRDRAGRNWLGTVNSGLHREDAGRWQAYPAGEAEGQLAHAHVSALLEDSNSRLWAGTFGGGLHRLDAEGRRFTRLRRTDSESTLASDYVYALHEDRSGVIWVGSEGGLDRIDINPANDSLALRRMNSFLPPDWLGVDPTVLAVAEDFDGRLWVGGPAGLVVIEPGAAEGQLVSPPGEAIAFNVQALRLTPDGALWVGTSDGLWRVARGDDRQPWLFEHYRPADGLPLNAVYGILPGRANELWLSGNNGLARFDLQRREFVSFRQALGLPSDEFNIGAAQLAADGHLLFGSIRGAVLFRADDLPQRDQSPPVVLSAFRRFEQPQPLDFLVRNTRDISASTAANSEASGNPLESDALPDDPQLTASGLPRLLLSVDDRVVAFDFAVLDFAAPELNRFRYRVLGLHDEWINLARSRTVVLSGLAAGSYRLEVQGAAAGRGWSPDVFRLQLEVRSPFWSLHNRYAAAFALLTMLTLIALALFWRRHRRLIKLAETRNIHAEQRQQRAQQERDRIKHDLLATREQLQQRSQQLASLSQSVADIEYTDALTQLPNRRRFLQQSSRFSDRYACLLLDIDGLGYINDQYGLDAGDDVMRAVARLLQQQRQASDLLFRWDSDKFLLMLLVDTPEQAAPLAERTRLCILQHAFVIGERRHIDLTCSIGFAMLPLLADLHSDFARDLTLRLAQQALVLAKRNSRNAWVGVHVAPGLNEDALRRIQDEGLTPAARAGLVSVISSMPTVSAGSW